MDAGTGERKNVELGAEAEEEEDNDKKKKKKKSMRRPRSKFIPRPGDSSSDEEEDYYDGDDDFETDDSFGTSRLGRQTLMHNNNCYSNKILLQALSREMKHGRVLTWLKVEGEEIHVHDSIVIIDSNCGMKYISSPIDGIMAVINAQEGEDVSVGSVLALVGKNENGVKRLQAIAKDAHRAEIRDRIRRKARSFGISSTGISPDKKSPPRRYDDNYFNVHHEKEDSISGYSIFG